MDIFGIAANDLNNNNNNKLYLYSTIHDMECNSKCFTEKQRTKDKKLKDKNTMKLKTRQQQQSSTVGT